MKKCVFSGTFDPPTKGHEKMIDECLAIFDEVVVAVMVNAQKTPLFTAEERAELIKKLYEGEKRVRVKIFNGAAVDLLNEENTPFYVRGIRNDIDLAYENANYYANKKLKGDIITVYLPCGQDELHISSTLIRNSVRFNKEFSDYLPDKIRKAVLELLEKKDV